MRLPLDLEVMADQYDDLQALMAELNDDEEPQEDEQDEELEWEWAA